MSSDSYTEGNTSIMDQSTWECIQGHNYRYYPCAYLYCITFLE